MKWWIKVLAVALAAVVVAHPVLAQISSVHENVVLPTGNELQDNDLRDIEGELKPIIWFIIGCILGGLRAAGTYCIIEVWRGNTPDWRIGLGLFAFGFLLKAAELYASARAKVSEMIYLPPSPHSQSRDAARWRY